ncbi:MAG: HD domain-containing protein [Firmicutes bacterium]|nr:HD domain-containing protein [Bacillota bacterium]
MTTVATYVLDTYRMGDVPGSLIPHWRLSDGSIGGVGPFPHATGVGLPGPDLYMMIKDMAEGVNVRGHYLVTRKELIPFSSKPGRFLLMQLADRTGEIRAIVWERGEELAAEISVGDVVAVEGRVTVFRDSLQIVCNMVLKPLPDEYSPEDFLPTTKRDREAMLKELEDLLAGILDSDCQRLLQAIFTEDFKERFSLAPAARSMHQAYVGGLLEHTLNVARVCETVAALYPDAEKGILLTGALLHDVGKVEEYALAAGIEMTDVGRLLGHVVMGYHMVESVMENLGDFPKEKALRIGHMLLSHHGQLEWGSPKEPQTLEACILHHADNLDGQVSKFSEILESGPPGQRWTNYDSRLGRSLFIGDWDALDGASEG